MTRARTLLHHGAGGAEQLDRERVAWVIVDLATPGAAR
jgi:hypothetical protein